MSRRALTAAALAFFFAAPTHAEENLVSGLSLDTVQITSNYSGTDLVVFGAIENRSDEEAVSSRETVVVVVRGPDGDVTVRRKGRVAGIWLNRARARLGDIPSYYFLASTRPLSDAASAQTLANYELGVANLRPGRVLSDGNSEPYRLALIRHLTATGLYTEVPDGVEFLTPTLFRVHVPVPASVPRGQYNVQVYLFRDGVVVSAQSTPLFVDQTGVERRLYLFAHQWPLTYGVCAVLMATLLGWLSALAFRRRG